MKKIKENLKSIYSLFRKSVERFPVTMITIFIITVISAINLNNNFFSNHVISNINSFAIIFSITTFLLETCNVKNLHKKIIFYVIASIISGVFVYGLNEIKIDFIPRLITCYCMSISIYTCIFKYFKIRYCLYNFSNRFCYHIINIYFFNIK